MLISIIANKNLIEGSIKGSTAQTCANRVPSTNPSFVYYARELSFHSVPFASFIVWNVGNM
jgi:hypothetical protein